MEKSKLLNALFDLFSAPPQEEVVQLTSEEIKQIILHSNTLFEAGLAIRLDIEERGLILESQPINFEEVSL